MRTPSFCAALSSLLIFANLTLAAGFERRTAIVEAVEKTKPSIVTIKIIRANGNKEIAGTGVIVDERGLVVTNKHVVGSGRSLFVGLSDGTEVSGDILMAEPRYDLAVVRIKAGRTLPALRLAPTSDLMVGEDVIAIGNPFGYMNTVSKGIVSALEREITLPSGDVLSGLIQTDASINPGNSGGPLLNINGEFIGINVALREGAQGIAFAINAGMVEKVLSQYFDAFRVSGVSHGLKTQPKVLAQNGDRQRLEVANENGALKAGDLIVAVGNREVTNKFDLERAFWGKKPGETVELKVKRQGQPQVVALTLAAGQGAGAVATVAPPSVTPAPSAVATHSVPVGIRR